MMRADALNSDNYPVRTEMTGMQQILISHIWSTDKRESKELLVEKHLSLISSMDKDK